jgi:hypothetical protein
VVIATGVWLVAFAVTLPKQLAAIYGMADAALAPYLTQMWLRAPAGSHMLMANVPWYSGYWVLRLLADFPDHRGLWEIAPWLVSTLAAACAGWATGKVAGKAAGLLVATALICTGSVMLALQFAWSIHGFMYVDVLLLGAFVVWLGEVRAHGGASARLLWPLTVAMLVVAAVGVASDQIVLAAGVGPFALAGALLTVTMGRGSRLRVGTAVALVTVGSFPGAAIFGAAMRRAGLQADTFPLALVPLRQVPHHLLLLTQSVFSLWSGYLHEGGTYPGGVLGYACSAVVLLLIGLSVALLWRMARAALARKPGRDGGPLASGPALAHAIFWAASVVATCAVYVGSTAPLDIEGRRYVVTAAYSILILGVSSAMTARRRRWAGVATAVGIALLISTGAIGLMRSGIQAVQGPLPTVRMSNEVNAFARSEHVSLVYTGYWDSMPLGWLTPNSVPVYPVIGCSSGLCPFANVSAGHGLGIDSWYKPLPDVRSMLVLDDVLASGNAMPATAPAYLGRPLRSEQLYGGRLIVDVYGYDIASKLSGS